MPNRSKYSEELAISMCTDIANKMSVAKAARNAGICVQTFFTWLNRHEEFKDMYATAKDIAIETMADDIIEIADSGNEEDTQRAKLRVDTRKWLMSQLKPKKYGNKVQVDGDIMTTKVAPLTKKEIELFNEEFDAEY